MRDDVASALAECRKAFVGTGLVSCILNILTLTAPMYMLQVSDRILSSRSVPTLLVISGLALALYCFFGILDYLRTRILGRIGLSMDARLSGTAFEAAAVTPLKPTAEERAQNPMRDLETLRQFLSGQGPSAIFDLPWMPLYLAVIFMFHPILGFVATGGAVCIAVLIWCNEMISLKPMQEVAKVNTERARFLEGCRRSAEAALSMGMVPQLKDRWLKQNESYILQQGRFFDLGNVFSTVIKILRFVMQSALLGVGAWLVIGNEVTPGVMIAGSIIASRALAPVEQAVAFWRSFVQARQSIARLKETFKKLPTGIVETRIDLPENELSVEGLSAGPIGAQKPYVMSVSFRLQAGEGLGIIGQSGSGKTTLVRSLIGICPTFTGSVRLDGAELNQWSREDIGRFVGYLPQDVQLMDGTIAQNIARFSGDMPSAEIVAAAKLADVHDMIVSMPGGYDTPIGEAGSQLSGGQRQRIGLARALAGDPFLVLLDEPNSNLDAEGEVALKNAIMQVKERGGIVIVIAHRVSAISAMDQLMAMEEGRVKRIGPRDELLKQSVAPVAAKAG